MRPWTSFAWPGKLTLKAIHEWLLASKFAACLVFLVSLGIGAYLFAPTDAINKRLTYEIERQLPVDVSLERISVLPILTFSGHNLAVVPRETPQYRFDFSTVTIDPWWGSLATGALGLEGAASGLGGDLFFRFNSSRDMKLEGQGLQIDLPLQEDSPVLLAGADINVRLESSYPFHLAEQHRLDFNAGQLRVSGLGQFSAGLDSLSLGRVQIRASGQQGVLKIEDLLASGGDLVASGSGEVLLAANLPNSRVNLVLSLKAGSQLPETLVSLLDFLGPKQADGTYRLNLTGTLSRPVLK